MPMTIYNKDYFNAIHGGFLEIDPETYHFCLTAKKETIHQRLIERGEEEGNWCFQQTDKCLAGFEDACFEQFIPTDEIGIDEIADYHLQENRTRGGAELLGLNRNVVRLTSYRQEWKELFEQEKELLESLIGEYVVDIQHIGSTAIEGIAAKPMIDVLIGLHSLDDVKKFDKHRLKKADIYHLGRVEIDGKEVLAKFSDLEELTKTHVYHVVEYGGDWWQQHTLFRDYLNEHPRCRATIRNAEEKVGIEISG